MKRILVVEDNRLERRLIIQLINRYFGDSVKVEYAQDGDMAMQLLGGKTFDLVITDLIMPGTEGIELIRYIKSNRPSTGIIAVSGGNPFYLNYAKHLGANYVFTKPLPESIFIEQVSSLLKISLSSPVSLS